MISFFPRVRNPIPTLLAGAWYRVVVFSGAEFFFWLPRAATRVEAREAAHIFVGPEDYDPGDIDSVRRVKAVPA